MNKESERKKAMEVSVFCWFGRFIALEPSVHDVLETSMCVVHRIYNSRSRLWTLNSSWGAEKLRSQTQTWTLKSRSFMFSMYHSCHMAFCLSINPDGLFFPTFFFFKTTKHRVLMDFMGPKLEFTSKQTMLCLHSFSRSNKHVECSLLMVWNKYLDYITWYRTNQGDLIWN